MEKSSAVVIGFLCFMLVVVQSGLFRRTPYGLKKIKPDFVNVGTDEIFGIDNFMEKYRKLISRRLSKSAAYELKKNTEAFVGDGDVHGNFVEEYRKRYVSDRGSTGANGDYYDYGACNPVKDNVPMSSCDQCEVACASMFTKALCASDSVNKGAYVCKCCI